MTVPKAGYRGDVYIGATKIAAANWASAGGERQMQAADELGDEIITDVPLQIRGGTITITGHYKLDTDVGQKLLATRFAAGTQITDLKLYTDQSGGVYLTPDDTTTPASFATVTNCRNVGDDKSGIGTFTATLLMSGVLKQVGDTAVVQVVSTGIHALAATAVEFVGDLVSMGGQTPISCYFEYGLTLSFGTDTSANKDDLTAIGMFGYNSGLLTAEKKYYWRAVGNYDTDKYVYGATKSFTTPAA